MKMLERVLTAGDITTMKSQYAWKPQATIVDCSRPQETPQMTADDHKKPQQS